MGVFLVGSLGRLRINLPPLKGGATRKSVQGQVTQRWRDPRSTQTRWQCRLGNPHADGDVGVRFRFGSLFFFFKKIHRGQN
jgi:hypothetical protein